MYEFWPRVIQLNVVVFLVLLDFSLDAELYLYLLAH